MPERDPCVDACIGRSAEFARPILEYRRGLAHATSPGVEETIKWGFPHFVYAGGVRRSMVAFQRHAAFTFWKGAMIDGVCATPAERDGMGQFGRLAMIADLPARRTLQAMLRRAMKLNEDRVRPPGRARKAKPQTPMPAELSAALAWHAGRAQAQGWREAAGWRRRARADADRGAPRRGFNHRRPPG